MRYGSLLPLLLWTAAAQPPAPANLVPASAANIRVESTLVLVPVTVTDQSNRYVLGLDRQDFRIFEDDHEQKIKQFSGEDAPLSVGLILDTSGSMGDKIDISRRAVAEFLKTMNPADEAFLIEFNDRADLVCPFTSNSSEILSKLKATNSTGMTALFDAMYRGVREMKKAKNPRKALVVVSDGGDNNSAFSAKEVLDLVREADVQIYAMGVFEPLAGLGLSAAELAGPRLLSGIAKQTGGRAFGTSNEEELPEIAARIGIELRNQYVLAYEPTNAAKDGKYRRVDVKLKQPDGLPGLTARWRLGYYAPTQ